MSSETIAVQVVLALPQQQQCLAMEVPKGTTAREAVLLAEQAGLEFKDSEVTAQTAALGIYSEAVSDAQALRDGDRVEIYRPLAQDPMVRRRQQAKASAKRN